MKIHAPVLALLLVMTALSSPSALAQNAQAVSIYVVGHPDDWQLFMGESAFNDLHDTHVKGVFIYLTSGDGGLGMANSFAAAREQAAQNSVRFVTDGTALPVTTTTGTQVINGRAITYWQYKNSISYFLRLPDGFPTGSQPKSLHKLYLKQISALPTVDGSASYPDWATLVSTVKGIIARETPQASFVWLNLAETNAQKNPGDHSDHLYASLVGQQATASLTCTKRLFAEYDTALRPANLSMQDVANKAGLLATYTQVMNRMGFNKNNSWDEGHKNYLMRSYSRTLACNQPAQ